MFDDFVSADEDAAEVARDLCVGGGVLCGEVAPHDGVDDQLVVDQGAQVVHDLHQDQYLGYWVTRQDVSQEIEKWAEWAALASAVRSAIFSVTCVTY